MPLRFPVDHFDLIAPLYDKLIPPANIESLLKYGQFPLNGKVLEVGGGTGRVARELIKIQANIFLLDRSFAMLRVATNHQDFKLTLGEAEHLPFMDNTFERILLIDTLHHVVDARTTLLECLRVLRIGGLLVIQEPDIEQWGGKLIAFFEKALLMRSHLLPVAKVESILSQQTNEITAIRAKHQYLIVCRKGN